MNKIFLSGNLTRDPEIRYTQSGKAMARTGIAVRRGWRKNSEGDSQQPEADFFNLVAWEKTAEFCGRYLTKGSRVVVEGRLQSYNYEAQDGTKRSGVDVIVDNIEFGESKRQTGGDSGNNSNGNNFGSSRVEKKSDFGDDFGGSNLSDDEVPF